MTEQLILVTGGTGMTGSRIAHRLRARDVPVRVASRSSACRLDWADPTTWDAALAGASAVYLAYAPDLAVPGSDDVLTDFTERAARAGVGRVVLLSGRGEPAAQRAEQAVQRTATAAGLAWTVVRCSWFVQNFTEGQFADAVRAGELALPVDDVVEPFVDADDIAEVAVTALLGDGHAGRTYELTGPRALGFGAAVAELAAATGRPVTFRPVPLAEFTAGLAEEGAPREVVELMAHLFTEVLDGRNAAPADGVQQALGRPATDLTDAVRRSALARSRA